MATSGTARTMSLGPAVCSHFSALTTALVTPCTVRGLRCSSSAGAYRQPPGMGPPNRSCVLRSRRVSVCTRISPRASSRLISGSPWAMAAMSPSRRAATAATVLPSATNSTSPGARPLRCSTSLANQWVAGSWAETPTFAPRSWASWRKAGSARGLMPNTHCGARPSSANARQSTPRWRSMMAFSIPPAAKSDVPLARDC